MSVSNKIAPYTKVILALSKSERACGQLGQLSQLSQLSQLNSSWAS